MVQSAKIKMRKRTVESIKISVKIVLKMSHKCQHLMAME